MMSGDRNHRGELPATSIGLIRGVWQRMPDHRLPPPAAMLAGLRDRPVDIGYGPPRCMRFQRKPPRISTDLLTVAAGLLLCVQGGLV